MKIAQIAPLMESVPPRLYGGTERIVSYLTDELVQLGHEVTLVRERRFGVERQPGAAACQWRCVSTPTCATRFPTTC